MSALQQLPLPLHYAIREGAPVDVLCSGGYRMRGLFVGRFRYADGTEGAKVDTGGSAHVTVPLAELLPAGVTI